MIARTARLSLAEAGVSTLRIMSITGHKNVDEIESILIESHDAAVDIIGSEPEKWRPTSRETADHSLPYMTAVALADGSFVIFYSPTSLCPEARTAESLQTKLCGAGRRSRCCTLPGIPKMPSPTTGALIPAFSLRGPKASLQRTPWERTS